MRKKIFTIVGARPQFVKCAPVSKILRKEFTEILIHTGQHYDKNMSDLFFNELKIPEPDFNLEIGSGTHAEQTGKMLLELERLLIKYCPDLVLTYGDTNSTIAGALAAAKLNIPVAHIEAGLRSFNRKMPEEINRIITDKLSDLLFCPTPIAVHNLHKEGVTQGVYHVGDVMYDAILQNVQIADKISDILSQLKIVSKNYFLATIHRAENTNDLINLKNIIVGLSQISKMVVLPLHPRTNKVIKTQNLQKYLGSNIKIIDPVSYIDMIALEKNSCKIFTDSGGVQKEAFFLKVPCVTMREETEWVETVQMGVNVVIGASSEKIIDAAQNFFPAFSSTNIFGNGDASQKIVQHIKQVL